MNIGMLWWAGNDPKTTFEEKVVLALNHYRNKYGCPATVVHVNPKAVAADVTRVLYVKIVRDKKVAAGHLWVGVEGGE